MRWLSFWSRTLDRTAARFADKLMERMTDQFAHKLMARMEDENALPLPRLAYDVTVDDPEMVSRHEYRDLEACSPRAAAVEAYKRAMRDEGFRCMAWAKPGDEVTVGAARDLAQWSVVHRAGKHPHIDYSKPYALAERA